MGCFAAALQCLTLAQLESPLASVTSDRPIPREETSCSGTRRPAREPGQESRLVIGGESWFSRTFGEISVEYGTFCSPVPRQGAASRTWMPPSSKLSFLPTSSSASITLPSKATTSSSRRTHARVPRRARDADADPRRSTAATAGNFTTAPVEDGRCDPRFPRANSSARTPAVGNGSSASASPGSPSRGRARPWILPNHTAASASRSAAKPARGWLLCCPCRRVPTRFCAA